MSKRESKKSAIFYAFGKRLRELRIEKGMTPAQFSKVTRIDVETLDDYESGKREPKLEAIVVMARALGVRHIDLLDIDIDDRDL